MTTELQEKPTVVKNTPAELVKKIPLGYVRIPEARIRKDLGDLEDLKKSLREIGLTVPISVTPDFILVAGQRRLVAAKELGWSEIDVCTIEYGELDRQLAEIDENLRRKDLEPLERAFAEKRRKELLIAKYGKFSPATQARSEEGTFAAATTKQPLFPLVTTDKNSSDRQNEPKSASYPPSPNDKPVSERSLAKERGVSNKKESGDVRAAEYAERYPALAKLAKKLGAIRELGKLRENGTVNDKQLAFAVQLLLDDKKIQPEFAAELAKLQEVNPAKVSETIAYVKEKKLDPKRAAGMARDIALNLISKPETKVSTAAELASVPRKFVVEIRRPSFINALVAAAEKEKVKPEAFIALCALEVLTKEHGFNRDISDHLDKEYRSGGE